MKKIFHITLCLAFVSTMLPVSAFAEQLLPLPPTYVNTVYFNKDVYQSTVSNKDLPQLKSDVLNQERSNRDQELLTRTLAQENAILVGKLQELQKQVNLTNTPMKIKDLSTSIETLRDLRGVMEDYDRQLDERNRQMNLRNEQTIELRTRIDRLEAFYTEVMNLNKSVEDAKKTSAAEFEKKQKELESQFKDEEEFLIFKNQTLVAKYQQLLDYKAQLTRTREDLQRVQANYQALLQELSRPQVKTPTPVPAPVVEDKAPTLLNETLENLKTQTIRLQQYQGDLKSKDDQLNQLQEKILKKDQEIAQLKADLAKSQQELAEVKSVLNIQQGAMEEIHQDLDAMKETVSELRDKYAHYDEGFGLIRMKILQLKDKLATSEAHASEMENQSEALKKLKETIADLTTQVRASKADLGIYQTQIKQLNASVADLTTQLATKNKEVQDKDAQIDQWKGQAQASEITIKDLKGQVSDLNHQISSMNVDSKEASRLKERVDLYNTLVNKHLTMQQLAVEKAALLAQTAQDNQSKAADYQNQVQKTTAYWQTLTSNDEKQLDDLRKDVFKKTNQIADLQSQLEQGKKHTAELESMLDIYQKKSDDSEGSAKQKTQEINQLQGDLLTVQESLHQKEKDLNKIKEYFFEFEKRTAAKTQELRDKTQQIALLNASVDQKNQSLADLQSKLKNLQDEFKKVPSVMASQREEEYQVIIERQKQDIAKLSERLNVAEERLKTAVDRKELSQTSQFLGAASDEISKLRDSVKQKELQIQDLEKRNYDNDSLLKELNKTKGKINQMMEDLYMKDKEVQRLKMQLSSRDQTIKPLAVKPETVSQMENKPLQEAQKQIASLKEELKKKDVRGIPPLSKEDVTIEDLKSQLKRARKEMEEIRAAAKDKSQEALELTKLVAKLQQQIRGLKGNPDNL
jgi:chromosome segregation ATPase